MTDRRDEPFSTRIDEDGPIFSGPSRKPVQMLRHQAYGDHGSSIHSDETARSLGFQQATIEGPTHFSQFVPLFHRVWGNEWFRSGCISVHFRNAAFEGDALTAFLRVSATRGEPAEIWMLREDGTEILRGTASCGEQRQPSALEVRRVQSQPDQPRIILKDAREGMRTGRIPVVLGFDELKGALYPFNLRQKLARITEPSDWYTKEGGVRSPWGRAIVPIEMISVLLKYSDEQPPFPVPANVVQLFADQEIRLLDGPVFVGESYEIDHEVIGFGGSRRTESLWVRTNLYRPKGEQALVSMLLNTACLKETYPRYQEELDARTSPSA